MNNPWRKLPLNSLLYHLIAYAASYFMIYSAFPNKNDLAWPMLSSELVLEEESCRPGSSSGIYESQARGRVPAIPKITGKCST